MNIELNNKIKSVIARNNEKTLLLQENYDNQIKNEKTLSE